MNNPKTIVVIGASRGIGKAIVQQLASQEEISIIALARNTEALAKAFSAFPNVKTGKLDLAKEVIEQLEVLLKQVTTIDLLINNAGILVNKPFPTLTHEDLTLSYQVNVISVM